MRLLAGWAGVLAVLTALVVEVGARAVVAGSAPLPLRAEKPGRVGSLPVPRGEVVPQRQGERLEAGFRLAPGEEKRVAYAAAKLCGVQATLFWSLALRESGGKHWGKDGRVLRSKSNAWGLAQIKVGTARDVDPELSVMDLWGNALAGACHLRRLLDKYGDTRTALQAYHAGEGRVDRRQVGEKSREYARDILGN